MLDFSPGPIHAVDGDRELSSPISYAILSGTIHTDASSYSKCPYMCTSVTAFVFMLGDDDGRFLIDRETGEVKLTRGVRDRLTTRVLHLQVMVRLKYSVGLKDIHFLTPNINLTALSFCLSVSCNPGLSGQRPQEVFCRYSLGPNSGSEPVFPGVRHG